MLPDPNLAHEIQALLSEKLLVNVESPATDLLATAILDSLTVVQLLTHLEEHFQFKVMMEELDIEDLRSIHSIARLVAAQKQTCGAD